MFQDEGIKDRLDFIEQIAWILFLKVYDFKEKMWKVNGNFESIIPEGCKWEEWAVDYYDDKVLTGDELINFVNNKLFPTLKNIQIDWYTPISQIIVRDVFIDRTQRMKNGLVLRTVLNLINEKINFYDFRQRYDFIKIYQSMLSNIHELGEDGEFFTPRSITDFVVSCIKITDEDTIADFAAGTCGFLVSALKFLGIKAQYANDFDEYAKKIYGVEKNSLSYLLGTINLLLNGNEMPEFHRMDSFEKNIMDYAEDDRFDVILMTPPYGITEPEYVAEKFPEEIRSRDSEDLFTILAMARLNPLGRAAVIISDKFLSETTGPKLSIKKFMLENFKVHTIVRLPPGIFSPYHSESMNILFFDNIGPTNEIWFFRVPGLPNNIPYDMYRPFLSSSFDSCALWWDNREEICYDVNGYASQKKTINEIQEGGYKLDYCGYPLILPGLVPELFGLCDEIQYALGNLQEKFAIISRLMEEKNQETFITDWENDPLELTIFNFNDKFINLWQSILMAAVRGRLTEQSPDDGDARSLVETISPMTLNDALFNIPGSWVWVRIKDIADVTLGNKTRFETFGEQEQLDEYMEYHQDGSFFGPKYLEFSKFITKSPLITVPGDSILMSLKAPRGVVNFTERMICIGEDIVKIELKAPSYKEYLFYVLSAFKNIFASTQINVSQKSEEHNDLTVDMINNQPIPLPPLEEQYRIIRRLDSFYDLIFAKRL